MGKKVQKNEVPLDSETRRTDGIREPVNQELLLFLVPWIAECFLFFYLIV